MRLLLEQSVRMLAETRGLAALSAEVPWLTKLTWGLTEVGDVKLDFDITLGTTVHEAVLVFPELFPHAPAYVRPRSPSEAWSTHQYPATGTLCLEWGPDNWHAGITGADLVRSTFKLLTFETLGPALGVEAPSRHVLTVGQQLRGKHNRFLVTPQCRTALAAVAEAPLTEVNVLTLVRANELVAIPTRLGADDGLIAGVPKELADPVSNFCWNRKGWVVRCDEWAGLPTGSAQPVVRDFLKAKGRWPWLDDLDRSGFLVLVDDQQGIRPIALSTGDGSTAFEYYVIQAASDEAARQPEHHEQLSDKRVALVGLGSVGSKVALTLARSGVRRFLLVDDDVLLPANLARHQLDWLSIGMSKVDGVSAAIALVQPDTDIETRAFRFAGQESSSYNTTVLQRVAACDLVIDATANPLAFSAMAAMCAHKKVPLVWGEVFAGGIGALMARSLPDKDASPLDVRSAIHGYLATLPEAPFKRAQGYDVDDAGEVHVAGDAEVSHLAASLAQFAIDALAGGDDTRFPAAAYLLGYQKAWCFEAPFDTRQIECPKAETGPAAAVDAKEGVSAFRELAATFFQPKC
jgi:hypothetical protein